MKIATKESVIASILRFVTENSRYPTKTDCRDTDWLYSAQTNRRVVGSVQEMNILSDFLLSNPLPDNPKRFCKQCGKEIDNKARVFCSRSCSAKFNNNTEKKIKSTQKIEVIDKVRVVKEVVDLGNCVHCSNKLTARNTVFCSTACASDHRLAHSIQNWLSSGKVHNGNQAIRSYLKLLVGDSCSVCGILEHNGKPITFEVDHISGDSTDDRYENVCLICPNCHSQTDTYKGRNRGNGRHSRAQRYREGKSY